MAKQNYVLPPRLVTHNNPAFQISRTGLQVFKGKLFNTTEGPSDESIGTSSLGTPIYDDVTFPSGQYKSLFGDVVGFDEVKLQSVLVVANQAKHVVKTAVQGRDGTVKEYISAGDFIISVGGVIVSETNTYPDIEVEAFRAIMEANAALSIVSSFINDSLGVGNVVIDNYAIRQIKGTRNAVEINFSCSSDVSRDIEELIIP